MTAIYDMEDYHCGHCGKYISPEKGYYGAADRKDGETQRIYCNQVCHIHAEGIGCEFV